MGELIDRAKGGFNNVMGAVRQETDFCRIPAERQALKSDHQATKGKVEVTPGDLN